MVCGPGEDGQRGERIPKGGKKGKGKAGKVALGGRHGVVVPSPLMLFLLEGKGKGKDGKAQGGEKPQSRHMVSASAQSRFQCRQDDSIRRFRHHWDSASAQLSRRESWFCGALPACPAGVPAPVARVGPCWPVRPVAAE